MAKSWAEIRAEREKQEQPSGGGKVRSWSEIRAERGHSEAPVESPSPVANSDYNKLFATQRDPNPLATDRKMVNKLLAPTQTIQTTPVQRSTPVRQPAGRTGFTSPPAQPQEEQKPSFWKSVIGTGIKGVVNTAGSIAKALDIKGRAQKQHGEEVEQKSGIPYHLPGLEELIADTGIPARIAQSTDTTSKDLDKWMNYDKMGTVERFLSDVGTSVPQMATLAIPGAGPAVFAQSAYGGYADEAIKQGASLEDADTYGTVGAGGELTLNRALGLIPGYQRFFEEAFGHAVATKNLTGSVFKEVGKIGSAYLRNAGAEALEEAAIDPVMGLTAKATFDKDREWTGDGGVLDFKQMAYDALAGATMAGMLQSPALVGHGTNILKAKTYIEQELPKAMSLSALMPAESEAHKLGAKMADKGRKVTVGDVDVLKATIMQDISMQKASEAEAQKNMASKIAWEQISYPSDTNGSGSTAKASQQENNLGASESASSAPVQNTESDTNVNDSYKKATDLVVSKGKLVFAQTKKAGIATTFQEFNELKKQLKQDGLIDGKGNLIKNREIHIDDRRPPDMSDHRIKAFHSLHPELRPYVVNEAQAALADLHATIKGQRMVLRDQEGNVHGVAGIKKRTSGLIQRIEAYSGVGYDRIEQGLKDIIAGGGKENSTLAKRIELAIDDMLTDGYTDFQTGETIPPDQNYIREKAKIKGEVKNNEQSQLEKQSTPSTTQKRNDENSDGQAQESSGNSQGTTAQTSNPDSGSSAAETGRSQSRASQDNNADATRTDADKVLDDFERDVQANGLQGFKVEKVEPTTVFTKQLSDVMEALGVKVVFYREVGESQLPDGYYNPKYKDHMVVKVQMNQNMMVHTLGHEFMHTIKENYPEIFKSLLGFARANFDSKAKMQFLQSYDHLPVLQESLSKNEDALLEEMLADELGNNWVDKSFWQKVFDYSSDLFQELVDFIQAMLDKITNTKYETFITQEVAKDLSELFKKQVTAIKADVLEQKEKAASPTPSKEALPEGIQLTDKDNLAPTSKFSVRTWTNEEKQALIKRVESLGISTKGKAEKYLEAIDNVAAVILEEPVLDYTPSELYSALKNNSDPHYDVSLDFSTLCKKRLVLQGTIEQVQLKLGRGLMPEEFIQVRVALAKKGHEVSCGACYVDSRRIELGKIANQMIKNHPELPRELFLSQDGFDQLYREHPEVYKELKSKTAPNGIKMQESRTEYRGEILKKFGTNTKKGYGIKPKVAKYNERSGLRWQSWSDLEVPHIIDGMQAIADMWAVKLAGHAYTKVVDFPRVFGKTGLMINLSLIPKGTSGLDADGNLLFDPVEGMDFEKARELRNQYPQTTGTIAIGVRDDQIKALLDHPEIDYVIPYHTSGLGKDNRALMGIGMEDWFDYSKQQKETAKDKKKNQKFGGVFKKVKANKSGQERFFPAIPDSSEYWDHKKTPQENVKSYLKAIEKYGLHPKFPQFVDHPNYWKLLIDRKTLDNDGKLIIQQPVQPIFDEAVIQEILKKYTGDHQSLPHDKAVVDELVKSMGKFSGREKTEVKPFFSQLQKVIDEKMPNSATVAQVLGLINPQKSGIKEDEIKWSGIKDYILGKDKVNKADLQAFLRANEVQVSEVTLKDSMKWAARMPSEETYYYDTKEEAQEAIKEEAKHATDSVKMTTDPAEGTIRIVDTETEDILYQIAKEGDFYELVYPSWFSRSFSKFEDAEAFMKQMRKDEVTNRLEMLSDEPWEEYEHDQAPGYAEYVLPGGKNYREILFTLPVSNADNTFRIIDILAKKYPDLSKETINHNAGVIARQVTQDRDGKSTEAMLQTYKEAADELRPLFKKMKRQSRYYTSPHWDGEDNVLAHTRITEREDDQGNPVLFVEEIQSDWHQAGRDKGYKGKFPDHVLKEALKNGADEAKATKAIEHLLLDPLHSDTRTTFDEWDYLSKYVKNIDLNGVFHDAQETGVPDAPFAKTWHEFVFKRALRLAAEGGFDRLAWTTGQQQNERYGLGEHADYIDYDFDDETLTAYDEYDNSIFHETIPKEKLPEYIGQAMTDKLLAEYDMMQQNPEEYATPEVATLYNADLRLGGEGMVGFYDKILPAFAKKYVKKWGSTVEKHPVITEEVFPWMQPRTYEVRDYTVKELQAFKKELAKDPNNVYEDMRIDQMIGALKAGKTFKEAVHLYANDELVKKMGGTVILKPLPPAKATEQWSVPITQAMKDSVLHEGQPMFSARKKVTQKVSDVTQTPEFKAWFGNSQVVDEDGKPLVVYHGTDEEFTVFDRKKQRDGRLGKGFYFTSSPEEAKNYGKNVIPVYLKIEHLYNGRTRETKGGGRKNFGMEYAMTVGGGRVFVVNSPSQIKSATNNVGTFDAKNPDIRLSMRRRMAKIGYNVDLNMPKVREMADNWKNKPLMGMMFKTPERVFEYVMGKDAKEMIRLFITPVHQQVAKANRWMNQEREEIRSFGIKPGSKESALVQKYGEGGWWVQDTAEGTDGKMHKVNTWRSFDIDDLKREAPKNWEHLRDVAEDLRDRYDRYLEMTNQVLEANGFDPIPKRKDYFMHFTKMNALFELTGLPVKDMELPTGLSGFTADFKPPKSFFQNALQRLGVATEYDAIRGIDTYIGRVADQIFLTESIGKLRALQEALIEKYSPDALTEELKVMQNMNWEDYKQIWGESKLNRKQFEEQRAIKKMQIESLFDKGGLHLGEFVNWLNQYTNKLANKKPMLDRAVAEGLTGRRKHALLVWLNNQVGANAIAFNLSPVLTQFIPMTQGAAVTSKKAFAKALWDTMTFKDRDAIISQSDFLTNRLGSDPIYKNLYAFVRDKGFFLNQIVDQFTSTTLIRAKYYEGLAKGMDHEKAMRRADDQVARIMADRSKGAMPVAFESQLLNIVMKYQLEVLNQLQWISNDVIKRKHRGPDDEDAFNFLKSAMVILQLFIYGWMYNAIIEKVNGQRPALDPAGTIARAYTNFTNPKVKDEQAWNVLREDIANQLPFTSFLYGGRIPLKDAIPNPLAVWDGTSDWQKELIKTGMLALPGGASQIKKTVEGYNAAVGEKTPGVYGDTEDGRYMKFPIKDNAGGVTQALLFGKYSGEPARKHFDEQEKNLTVKETEMLDKLVAKGYDSVKVFNTLETVKYDKAQKAKVKEALTKLTKLAEYIEEVEASDLSESGKKLKIIAIKTKMKAIVAKAKEK